MIDSKKQISYKIKMEDIVVPLRKRCKKNDASTLTSSIFNNLTSLLSQSPHKYNYYYYSVHHDTGLRMVDLLKAEKDHWKNTSLFQHGLKQQFVYRVDHSFFPVMPAIFQGCRGGGVAPPYLTARKMVRIIRPCVLSINNINVAFATAGLDFSPPASEELPFAVCTRHGHVGFILETKIHRNIIKSHDVRITDHHRNSQSEAVRYMYNECALVFPTLPDDDELNKNNNNKPSGKKDLPNSNNNNNRRPILGQGYYGSSSSPTYYDEKRFLKYCEACEKILDVGEPTYMYRDAAFCSLECREVLLESDGEMDLIKLIRADEQRNNPSSEKQKQHKPSMRFL